MSSMSSSSASGSAKVDDAVMYCDCGLIAPRWTAWTPSNPGRRFYGCPNYKNSGNRKCNFFEWVDEEMTKRAKEVIIEQRDKCKSVTSQNSELIKELELLSHEKIEMKKEMQFVTSENTELKSLNMDLGNAIELIRCENTELRKAMDQIRTENMEFRKALQIIRSFNVVDNNVENKINKVIVLVIILVGMLIWVLYKCFRRSTIGDELPMLG